MPHPIPLNKRILNGHLLLPNSPNFDGVEYASQEHGRRARHWAAERIFARLLFGATDSSHEHYIRARQEQWELNSDRRAWMAHFRLRWHQIERWVEWVQQEEVVLTPEEAEAFSKFDYYADEIWTAHTWVPPVGSPDLIADAKVSDDPIPGPPPGWKPTFSQAGVDVPNRVRRLRTTFTYRARVAIVEQSPTDNPPVIGTSVEGVDLPLGEFTEVPPKEAFTFAVKFPEGVDVVQLRLHYEFMGTTLNKGGRMEFVVRLED